MDRTAIADLLGETGFGWDLRPDVRERLAAAGRLVELPARSVVLEEGAASELLGILLEGRLAIRLAVPGRADRTILTIEPGDVFGWSAVLPIAVATSTCIAMTDCSAIVFDRTPLRALLDADSELAAAIYRRLLWAVAGRLSATRLQLLDLYRSAEQVW